MSQPVITEEWRKVPGLRPIYEVSNFGEVRSNSSVAKGQLLKARVHEFHGFPQVRITDPRGRRRWFLVHELVARAFPEGEK
ncbi:NUMOD4 domain-containing protein [Streptomyces sp. NPDC020731]|uniref:NUMOD4 domain-containing protein n=1 Tax=Streptomyces sp. NPDC020731 TaxID=3365085 RepID=UPI0037B6CA6E